MNWYPLLALLAFAYAAAVLYIVIKKPPKIMQMGKLQAIEKMLGKKGADIFYYVWAVVFAAMGIWLLTL